MSELVNLGSQNECNTCYGVAAMGHCYGQLSLEERIEIYRRRAAGESMQMIAQTLARHVSTISRELSRNSRTCKIW
jgi:IS30 family transposase